MKILATFDGTRFGERSLPLLAELSEVPPTEITLLRVVPAPTVHGEMTPEAVAAHDVVVAAAPPAGVEDVRYPETRDQAIDRARSDAEDYLQALRPRLAAAADVHIEVRMSDDAASVIIERARELRPTMIVMATHSREGVSRIFVGSTADKVVHAGVAPVLLVHPETNVLT